MVLSAGADASYKIYCDQRQNIAAVIDMGVVNPAMRILILTKKSDKEIEVTSLAADSFGSFELTDEMKGFELAEKAVMAFDKTIPEIERNQKCRIVIGTETLVEEKWRTKARVLFGEGDSSDYAPALKRVCKGEKKTKGEKKKPKEIIQAKTKPQPKLLRDQPSTRSPRSAEDFRILILRFQFLRSDEAIIESQFKDGVQRWPKIT